MTEAPPLHPFLQRLALRLLARCERSEGSGPVRLRLDAKEAPELHGQTHAEEVQRWVLLLQDLCATGWVALALGPAREFAGFTDRRPQLELRDFDALAQWAGYTPRGMRWQAQWMAFATQRWLGSGGGASHGCAPGLPAAGAPRDCDPRDHEDRRVRSSAAHRDSAQPHHGAELPAMAPVAVPLLDYLARNPLPALQDLPLEEAARTLEALRSLCLGGEGMFLREASARVFQGRSKVLDSREELLRLLGAAPGQFLEAPIQLLVDVPPRFEHVLFVENLVTFEHMAQARAPAWAHALLVYAAGFKGSGHRLRTRQGCRLHVRVSPGVSSLSLSLAALEAWLFEGAPLPASFFGDLDFAGMQILRSLREVFGDIGAWQPGYDVLAALLDSGGGHAPAMAGKELQLDPGRTGCPYADARLLPLLRERGVFVDQEAFVAAGGPALPA